VISDRTGSDEYTPHLTLTHQSIFSFPLLRPLNPYFILLPQACISATKERFQHSTLPLRMAKHTKPEQPQNHHFSTTHMTEGPGLRCLIEDAAIDVGHRVYHLHLSFPILLLHLDHWPISVGRLCKTALPHNYRDAVRQDGSPHIARPQ
jgi:hypothetical protein